MTMRALRSIALLAALAAVLVGCNNGGSGAGSTSTLGSAAPPGYVAPAGSVASPAPSDQPSSKGNY